MSELLKALKGASESKQNGKGTDAPSAAELLASEELEDEIREAFPGADPKKVRALLRKLREDD